MYSLNEFIKISHIIMNKLFLKILIPLVLAFIIFLIYLGTTDFIVKPKIIESEYKIEKN
tara:strand:+ start:330 stop:506 length:177 start_codon:yes stop_codon:yes gene_type:complete